VCVCACVVCVCVCVYCSVESLCNTSTVHLPQAHLFSDDTGLFFRSYSALLMIQGTFIAFRALFGAPGGRARHTTPGPQLPTLHPQPSTPNPPPSNPPPSTLNSQPSTLNSQPSTLNTQLPTLNPTWRTSSAHDTWPSTLNSQLPTPNPQLSTLPGEGAPPRARHTTPGLHCPQAPTARDLR